MIETSAFLTSLDSRGFIMTRVKAGAMVEVHDARANTEAVAKLSGERILPILVDLREISSISKEARDHFSMQGRKAGVTSIAMLISSPVSRIIGNFFLGLNKPTVPTRLFTSEKEAVKWVLTQVPLSYA